MRKRILIADDSKLVHERMANDLGEEYELLHAYDGADTLLLAFELLPDLLILDIMMPMLDGRTICKKLRAHPRTKGMKIIMVSAKNAQSDRLVGFEVGADDYVEKPYTVELLTRSVRRQLG